MFSHTLGRRTLNCYLMLAVVLVDEMGFFRRASECMHNNFAIYCGLVRVHCRCYIGLECTILFLSEPTHCWVVGQSGPWPIHDFTTKTNEGGSNHAEKATTLTKYIFEVTLSTFIRCSILLLKNMTDVADLPLTYHRVCTNKFNRLSFLRFP